MGEQLWVDKDIVMNNLERTLHYQSSMSYRDPLDKLNLAFIKLLNPGFNTQGVPAFKTLAEAYVQYSGDDAIKGRFCPNRVSEGLRASISFNSGSFSYALQNAMNVYVSKEFKRFPYREEIFITDRRSAKDFRTIKSIQMEYYGDLPDIDPEAGDYQTMPSLDDTEASYNIGQKGIILWISRKVILNDSIDIIKGLIARMTRSARMTHAKKAWSFYLNNSDTPDGKAWFHVDHENVTTGALTIPNLITAITALATMTEPGESGEILGLDFKTFDWHLVVPVTLWSNAVTVNQNQSYFPSNDLSTKVPNPCYRLFGEKNERIIISPFGDDTDDWGVLRGSEDVPIVEMSYLNGQEEPELILHKGPTVEWVFTSEKIGYKIRHEYGGSLAGYRGGYKAINS